jgi:hypothetical protein
MRPLAKVTLYAGLNSNVSRTVFFRRDETIILRVQARASGDADGTYRIRLGGTFAPSTAPVPAETESASANTREKPTDRNTRRVNSVGARIEEPRSEVAPEPAPSPAETASTSEPAPTKSVAKKTPVTKGRTTARRGAPPRGAAQPPATGEGAKAESDKSESSEPGASSETARTEPARTNTGTNRARTRGARTSRAGTTGAANRSAATTTPSSSSEPAAPPSAEPASPGATAMGLEAPGSRLVLELRGGERVVREMSEVRRVAIEGRLIVIVLKNGRIERQPLANVTRMTIEP